MVNINIISIVAFLVLACLLAGLVAVARARRKALPPGGFPVENSYPGRQGFRLGGVAGVGPGAPSVEAVESATAAAFAALRDLAAVAAAAVNSTTGSPVATAAAATTPVAPAAPAAIAATFQSIDLGDGGIAYYAERSGLPVTEGFDPAAPTYFVFEKLCPQNRKFWEAFVNAQDKAARERDSEMDMTEGTVALTRTLQLSGSRFKCSEKYDMWVAYVSAVRPTVFKDRSPISVITGAASDVTGIEMAVSVLVHPVAPVTSHSGIFRTFKHWRRLTGVEKAQYIQKNFVGKGLSPPEEDKDLYQPVGHGGLSVLLHSFAAAAARHAYPHLRDNNNAVMATRPVKTMGAILRKVLKPGEFTVGSQDERSQEYLQKWGVGVGVDLSVNNYVPKLGQEGDDNMLYVLGVDGVTGVRTWTIGGKVYDEPEWVRLGDNCKHIFISIDTPGAALEYTIRLSALARAWRGAPN